MFKIQTLYKHRVKPKQFDHYLLYLLYICSSVLLAVADAAFTLGLGVVVRLTVT